MTAIAPAPFQFGFRLEDGQALDRVLGYPTVASEDNIVASTTQTQAAAYQLTAQLSRITTSANSGNGVALPTALVGKKMWVINDASANAIQVYGNAAAGDTINSVATATGISQPANTIYFYTCTTAGNWILKNITEVFTNLTVNGLLTLGGSAVGTILANGATGVVTANTNITANSLVLISLSLASGTVGAIPHLSTLTASTSFTTVATAGDTSLYNYAIVQA